MVRLLNKGRVREAVEVFVAMGRKNGVIGSEKDVNADRDNDDTKISEEQARIMIERVALNAVPSDYSNNTISQIENISPAGVKNTKSDETSTVVCFNSNLDSNGKEPLLEGSNNKSKYPSPPESKVELEAIKDSEGKVTANNLEQTSVASSSSSTAATNDSNTNSSSTSSEEVNMNILSLAPFIALHCFVWFAIICLLLIS